MHIFICIYICLCIYIHTHIYIYIYICIYLHVSLGSPVSTYIFRFSCPLSWTHAENLLFGAVSGKDVCVCMI